MAIGNYYPVSGTVVDQDLFLGTKAGNNNTVNYTAQTVANYLNTNSKVAIGGQISFRFDISPNIPKTISFSGGGGSGTPFSSITQLIVSGIDLSSTDITIFLNYLNGSEILLAQQNQPNLFGNYKITSYTQIGTSNFYTLGLQFIGGNGTITENTYYNLSSFVLSSGIDVPTLNQVLTAGNTSIIDAKVGNLYSYDNVNADYGIVQFYDSGVALKGASTNNLLFYNDDTGTVKFSNGTYAPTLNFAGVGNNVYTFQNANGTLAFLSDIPSLNGYVPYTGATGPVNLGAFDLTVNGLTIGRGSGTGATNTALGSSALLLSTTGYFNVAAGAFTLTNNTTGNRNSAFGYGALYGNLTGNLNVAIGSYSLFRSETGIANVSLGYSTLQANLIGSFNTGLGYRALFSNLADKNTAVGTEVMFSNTTGTFNTVVGQEALRTNLAGSFNSIVGNFALLNAEASYVSALGRDAGRFSSTGNLNTASESIFIGYNSKSLNTSSVNEIVIGANAVGLGNNTIVLGSDSIVTTALIGNVGIGTKAPLNVLDVVKNQAGSTRINIENTDAAGTSTLRFTKAGGAAAALFENASNQFTFQNATNSGTLRFQTTTVGGSTLTALTVDSNQNIEINNNLRVIGALYDSTNSPGTLGQVLASTVTGTDWVNAGTVTSIGMTVPSAFNVTPSTITSSGTFAITGAGVASQYVRGDGTLANFPTSTGGGASVSYYLNGSISQGTIGGVAYKEMNSVPVIGTGTDFTINADGYIAQFITDVGDPNKLLIPGGNWNFETYFSASSGGGSPSFYIELYKYNGTTFTLIASNSTSPENITGGTSIDLYFSALAVPPTTLTVTDRLAVRFYVIHSGRTITMHTENSHLSQVITTFSSGLTALNGLTSQVQYFAVGTSGTDFNISSATDTHTFNLPTASAVNRGALSSADWTAFNSKANASGTTNYVSKFTGTTTLGNSQIFDNGTNVGIGTTSPAAKLHINNASTAATNFLAGNVNGGAYFGWDSDNTGLISTYTNAPIKFGGNYASSFNEWMRINSSGNVGIGTTSPNSYSNLKTLTINGTNGSVIDFTANGVLYGEIYAQANDFRIDAIGSSGVLKLLTNSAERMRITSSGSVGIGTSSPGAILDILATSSNILRLGRTGYDTFLFRSSIGTGLELFNLTDLRSEMFFDGNGNVGIGTTSPTAKLHIAAPGALSTDIALKVRNSADTADLMTVNGVGQLGIDRNFGLKFLLSSVISAPSNGSILITDAAGTSFGRFQFGGTSNLFPSIKRNTTNLEFKLADDSAFTGIISATSLVGGTSLNSSAILQADSTTKGFLPPRMTNAQRLAIATPAVGLCVYCTDAVEGLYINKSTGWTFII